MENKKSETVFRLLTEKSKLIKDLSYVNEIGNACSLSLGVYFVSESGRYISPNIEKLEGVNVLQKVLKAFLIQCINDKLLIIDKELSDL